MQKPSLQKPKAVRLRRLVAGGRVMARLQSGSVEPQTYDAYRPNYGSIRRFHTGWSRRITLIFDIFRIRVVRLPSRNAKSTASNVRRFCALLCPAISFLHFHVLQVGPSFSRPAISCPANWSVKVTFNTKILENCRASGALPKPHCTLRIPFSKSTHSKTLPVYFEFDCIDCFSPIFASQPKNRSRDYVNHSVCVKLWPQPIKLICIEFYNGVVRFPYQRTAFLLVLFADCSEQTSRGKMNRIMCFKDMTV